MNVNSSALPRFVAACVFFCTLPAAAPAQANTVREPQGTMHGFLSLQSAAGGVIGYGEALQSVHHGRVVTRLVLHFDDGSLHDETTSFTQDRNLRFLSDHLIQRGPLFPKPVDLTLTADGNLVLHSRDGEGGEQTSRTHLTLPPNIANGMVPVLLLNAPPQTTQTDLSMVVPHGKGRLITLKITPDGTEAFTAAGAHRTADVFLIHTQLGGITGLVAPLLDKQPLDGRLYEMGGEAPQFLRLDTQLAEDGPLISIRLAGTVFSKGEATKH